MLTGHGSIPFRGWTAVRVVAPSGAGHPVAMATPFAWEVWSPARQPRLSTAMPSPRPAACALASAQRRARPWPWPWPGPLPVPLFRSGPGPVGTLGCAVLIISVRTMAMEMGKVTVLMDGASVLRRAGVCSTTSRTATRRMSAGSCVRPDRRKVARSARERVWGWRRSIPQLLPRMCSAVRGARLEQECRGVQA